MNLKFPISLVGKIAPTGIDLSYLGFHQDLSVAQSYTFSDCDLGEPHPDRQIIVAIGTRTFGNFGTLAITIGGVLSTIDQVRVQGENSTYTQIHRAVVPSGASGDIVLNFSNASDHLAMHISIYRAVGSSISVHDIDTEAFGFVTSSPRTLTVDAVKGGGLLGVGVRRINGGLAWTGGLTADESVNLSNKVTICTGHTNLSTDDPTYEATLDLATATRGHAALLISYKNL